MRICWAFFLFQLFGCHEALITEFPEERILKYREKVKSMFYHAYNGYLNHAYPFDELKPLSCTGMNTWGSFSLTLIDALDTLLIMGNHTEFMRAVDLVLANADVDANVNVSVFETNIRVVGGLLSAHLLSARVPDIDLHSGWPCAGPLLDLAQQFADKLLPAFNTDTGMPYGTVNLRYGVNRHETPITCTAGVGTFIIEFGTLSRLTGNPIYERVALRALKSLWASKSPIGLVGNHINVQTGVWTATDSGIGAGVDSYFEYLAKAYETAINKYVRKDDWFMWVSMSKGQVNLPIYQSLEAFWPGVLALVGNIEDAHRIMLNYDQVNKQFGAPPEFFNLPTRETVAKRAGYPLRPEFVESVMYLYKVTDDPHYLHMAASIIETIETTSKTSCGYATIQDINKLTLEDRMESFFLSETTKYLYLIFDPWNFMHNDGSHARVVNHPSGECVVYAGGYIFNTEAHPVDPAALYCCSANRAVDEQRIQKFKENIDFASLLDLNDPFLSDLTKKLDEGDLNEEVRELGRKEESAEDIDKELEELEKHWQQAEEKKEQDTFDEEDQPNLSEQDMAQEDNVQVPLQAAEEDNVQASETKPPITEPSVSAPFVQAVQATDPSELKKERTRRRRKGRKHRRDRNNIMPLPPDQPTEEEEKERVKKQEVDTIMGNSDSSTNLLSLLGSLGHEYSNLLKATEKLQQTAAARSDKFQKIKKDLVAKKIEQSVPIVEALCDDCCVPLDAQRDSVALRVMLNMIYSKHIYTHTGIPFGRGPICRESEKPDPAKDYNADRPDLPLLEPEDVELDAVEALNFGTFAYRRLAAENHALLTVTPAPFDHILLGMGQYLPKDRNPHWKRDV